MMNNLRYDIIDIAKSGLETEHKPAIASPIMILVL